MKTQHTPTPWRNPQDSVTVCNDETGKKVCDTSWGVTGAKEALANAAFIVKACNCHEALLKALNICADWFCLRSNGVENGMQLEPGDVARIVKAAIAKAQE